jgi:hypothetical protein
MGEGHKQAVRRCYPAGQPAVYEIRVEGRLDGD